MSRNDYGQISLHSVWHTKNSLPLLTPTVEPLARCCFADAQAMLNLTAIRTSDPWDEFDKYRIQQETTRSFPYRESLIALEWPSAA
jgi:hypothetical protein